jgi:V8-like Glu-specific endopeptidase
MNALPDQIDYALVGPRDNRVHEIRTEKYPFNTICHLGRDFGDGVWRGCTGTLIGPRMVLTAGH